jgi:hypothetical protein
MEAKTQLQFDIVTNIDIKESSSSVKCFPFELEDLSQTAGSTAYQNGKGPFHPVGQSLDYRFCRL